ncbi:hypothetical protein HDU96_007450 [Phlyctochytrium bullatum]|nr:hypothetical protein HDU96_007450 [Phlyctochytrium bullatum]
MKPSATVAAVAVATFLGSTSTTAIPSPHGQPIQNQTLEIVTISGNASTYNDCSFYRDAANLQCSGKLLPYNPTDGPTSGSCITASAAYGDLCIRAVDKNETLPFTYTFSYPQADFTNDNDAKGEEATF